MLFRSKADRDFKTREAYIADQDAGELAPAFRALASRVSYTLKTVEVNQDKATVKVEGKRPDMNAAMAKVIPDVMGLAFANMGSPPWSGKRGRRWAPRTWSCQSSIRARNLRRNSRSRCLPTWKIKK